MKTSELTGAALNWAVAVCEGFTDYDPDTETMMPPRKGYGRVNFDEYSFSTDWAQGGPIIERECISVEKEGKFPWAAWSKAPFRDDAEAFGYGESLLIAAMRCYVASKLGGEIEIPAEVQL